MSDEVATVVIETPPSVADTSVQLTADEILYTLRTMRDEWETRMAAMEQRLANQPPATVVQVETTVEAPAAEPEAATLPLSEEVVLIGEPETTLTEAQATEAIAESESEVGPESGATIVEMETPPTPVEIKATRQRGGLANLLLGKRHA